MYYVGLDLHKRYVTACALDSGGAVVATERRLPTGLEPLLRWLAGLGGPATVAVEATLHWAWVHDHLMAAGYAVVVAHPAQVKLIAHARCKTDPIDAKKLADLLRTNLLPVIWVADAETRTRRRSFSRSGGSVGNASAARCRCRIACAVAPSKRKSGTRAEFERQATKLRRCSAA